MTKHELNILNMFNAVGAVCSKNKDSYADMPAIVETVTAFNNAVTKVEETNKQYLSASAGRTSTKNFAEEELLESLMPVKSALYSLAVKTKNEEMKVLTADSEYHLRRMRDGEFLNKAQMIKAEAQKRIADLTGYKITAEVLTDLEERIVDFTNALSGKDTGFANRSALRKELSEKIEEANTILKEHLDSLIELIRKSNPIFYNEYYSARVIKDLGASHKTPEEPAQPIK